MGNYTCSRALMCSHIFALIEGKGLSSMYGVGENDKPNVLSKFNRIIYIKIYLV